MASPPKDWGRIKCMRVLWHDAWRIVSAQLKFYTIQDMP